MSTGWTILVAVISCGSFTALVNFILDKIRSKKDKETGVAAGVRMLLYNTIKQQGKGYLTRGWITSEELEDLVQLHDCYHNDLDGNGFLDTIMNSVRSLPIKDK